MRVQQFLLRQSDKQGRESQRLIYHENRVFAGPVKYVSYSSLENSIMGTEFDEFTVYQTPDETRS